jgi:hypothetical protein
MLTILQVLNEMMHILWVMRAIRLYTNKNFLTISENFLLGFPEGDEGTEADLSTSCGSDSFERLDS